MPATPVTVPYAAVAETLPRVPCAGERITTIEILRSAPSSRTAGERARDAATEAVGLEHASTSVPVIQAYLRLRPGGICTEVERAESERLLRAQKFVASAAVTAFPDGEGHVRIRVDVVDEWPYIAGIGVKDGAPSSVRLGTVNLRGRGTTVVTSFEKGGAAYRTGYGLRVEQYGVLGRPAYIAGLLERRPLGGTFHIEAVEPFLTYRQRNAFRVSFTDEARFVMLARPDSGDAAAETSRSAYDVAWVTRAGSPRRDGTVGIAGVALMREEVRTGTGSVVISDSGLVPTLDTELDGRYPSFTVGRAGLILGVRAMRFLTVERYATLRAAQDVGRGVRASVLVAPSMSGTLTRRDVLISGDFYAGVGGVRSLLTTRVGVEGRSGSRADGWRGVAGSARADWYRLPSERRTRVTSVAVAVLDRAVAPSQLTFRDREDGLLAFSGSHDAGGRRITVRHEERVLVPWFRRRADLAVAAFADAGMIWAGDVPYGANTPARGSIGIALLGAYPFGKRTYRLDIAFPVNPGPGDGALQIRLGSSDHSGTFWMEAGDVVRARAGSGPATLTRW